MSGLIGLELARQVIAVRPNLPVILFTGYSELISGQKTRAFGIREFVKKPVLEKDMAEAVRRAGETDIVYKKVVILDTDTSEKFGQI